MPRWPTFGIDLTHVRPDRRPTDSRIWMPKSNGGGINPDWTRLSDGPFGTAKLVVAIIDAARNWVNSLQAIAPGYRDRIVHIGLDKQQGGLNLTMPKELVTSLNEYGKQAAERLIEHFIYGKDQGEPMDMTWNNQRWIRYRSTMALLETFLADFAHVVNNPEPGDPPYSDLIKNNPSYDLEQAQRIAAITETQALTALEPQMKQRMLEKGTPRPEPTLVIRPSF